MLIGDRVTVSRYHGWLTGVIVGLSPGHVTVKTNGVIRMFDLSRRTVLVVS